MNVIMVRSLPHRTLSHQQIAENPIRFQAINMQWDHMLTIYNSIVIDVFLGSGFCNVLLRGFGFDVAIDACLLSVRLLDPGHVHIGSRALVEDGASINGHVFAGYTLHYDGLAWIGNGASVGRRSYLHGGDRVEDGGFLGSMSKLHKRSVPAMEQWRGIPAYPIQ